LTRLRLEVRGAVQGVGFRPFVYRLAHELGLRGWVQNDGRGVRLEVEGERRHLDQFRERLQAEAPPLAVVQDVSAEWLAPVGFSGFDIQHSDAQSSKRALLLPDVATCAACLGDLTDPTNRRHGYPFTNCTGCGPRFSIVRALPYDRPNTTMAGFTQCAQCQAEYDEPRDRRFHAQPNACADCGPRVWLATSNGQRQSAGADAIRQAAQALRDGFILALKGLGGFQLLADATSPAAVKRLRQRKRRWEKPLALMVGTIEHARALATVSEEVAAALTGPSAPIVLVPRRPDAPVTAAVAPGTPLLGLMLPYTPLHHLLMHELQVPVVATSGNLSDEPICIDNGEALVRLGEIADLFLLHDRPIERHVDDSVAVWTNNTLQLVRRARGYAPLPVRVNRTGPTVIAVGSHLKNTIALALGHDVFVSQHIGDLDTRAARDAHQRVIRDFSTMYETVPEIVAHDLHPDYASTQWAHTTVGQARNGDDRWAAQFAEARLVGVQHHHAHLVACLADNGIEETSLGVTWDGTGYGNDGTVWGGELLLGDARGFRRVAHFWPFRLPGGEAAVREPRRSALAALLETFGQGVCSWEDLASIHAFSARERDLLLQMLRRGVNSPVTTSAGRLFDAVASVAGLRQVASYDGQAAMELEHVADRTVTASYPFPVSASEGSQPLVLDWRPLLSAVVDDVRQRTPVGEISAKFHHALAQVVVQVAREVGNPRVALSGGCFQNLLLSELCAQGLSNAGFMVLRHRQVPTNDGGISLGQAVIAVASQATERT